MKKIFALLLALVCALTPFTVAFGAQDICIISQDTTGIYLVVPARTQNTEQAAADVLSSRLQTIFGIEVKIAKDNQKTAGNVIAIGNTVYAEGDFSQKKTGSYVIAAFNGGVSITGNGNRGLMDGICRFLSEFCDYEVYTRDVIGYTTEKSLVVPADTKIEYSPFFEYRKVDTLSAYNWEYARVNSVNSTRPFALEEGGMIEYITYNGHSLTNQFCNKDKYFKEHPEYFALWEGERVPDQLCLTNPDVLRIVTEELLAILKEKHNPEEDLQIVSLTQADNQHYCTCKTCAALDAKNHSHAGTMLTFVNEIADVIAEKGYSNVGVDTFAYQYTRTCPTQVVPRDNVIVRLCSIECCFGHTLDDPNCKENVAFMQDLAKWNNICHRLYIWDYVNNYSETLLPFANLQVLQRNMQIFYENGAKGIFEEGNYYMNLCNGEFYELRSYLLCKLMQDPYRTDFEDLTEDYLLRVYGEGGGYLKEFIELLSKRSVTKTKHLYIRQQPIDCLPGITAAEIRKADSLWEKAKAGAKTEQQRTEVQRSELCWQYWKCCRMKGEYSPVRGLYSYMTSHKQLYDKIVGLGNTYLGEGDIKQLREHPFSIYFLSPTKWESKYDGKFWHKLDPAAEKFYNFLNGIFGA